MAIDWAAVKAQLVNAAVLAVNQTLYIGEEKALRDVPVRKVFRGGRQTVRFKTAEEVEGDRELRARLGLAPEILATPEAQRFVRSRGFNPARSNFSLGAARQGPVLPRSAADRNARLPRIEAGFARTVNRPIAGGRVNKAGLTASQRGLTRNSANRANVNDEAYESRILKDTDDFGHHLDTQSRRQYADENYERYETVRGRYERTSGRAISQRTRTAPGNVIRIGGSSGVIVGRERITVGVGPARVGGGLKSTIRIIKATPSSYPVIEGHLVAGDKEHDYAIHQELGNRHNPAHPFLRPRLPEWKEELPAQLKKAVGRALTVRVAS